MPSYKLLYFPVRARAECARQIFAQAGEKYEDVRIPKEKWAEMKSNTPFGQVPVLEVDGVQIAQSSAICRYLARQFGLAGKSPIEEALVDSLADANADYFNACRPWFMILAGFAQGDKEEKYKECVVPALDKFLPPLENFLKKSGSGFLVGNDVTWADLLITELLATQQSAVPNILEGHPEIQTWMDKVRGLPNIKKWIEERPQTPF